MEITTSALIGDTYETKTDVFIDQLSDPQLMIIDSDGLMVINKFLSFIFGRQRGTYSVVRYTWYECNIIMFHNICNSIGYSLIVINDDSLFFDRECVSNRGSRKQFNLEVNLSLPSGFPVVRGIHQIDNLQHWKSAQLYFSWQNNILYSWRFSFKTRPKSQCLAIAYY